MAQDKIWHTADFVAADMVPQGWKITMGISSEAGNKYFRASDQFQFILFLVDWPEFLATQDRLEKAPDPEPVDMIIHCPNCGLQHIDRPDRPDSHCPTCDSPSPERHPAMQLEGEVQPCSDPFHKGRWSNPPHKSHTCRKDAGGCGHIFPVAAFPTNGVAAISRKGKDDTWTPGMLQKTEIDRRALDLALTFFETMGTEAAEAALHAIADLRGELSETGKAGESVGQVVDQKCAGCGEVCDCGHHGPEDDPADDCEHCIECQDEATAQTDAEALAD